MDSNLTQDQQIQLENILDYTRQMLELADRGQWQALTERQAQRQRLLCEFFSKPVTLFEAPSIASGLLEVLAMDDKLIERAEAAQRAISERLKEISLGRRAQLVYIGRLL